MKPELVLKFRSLFESQKRELIFSGSLIDKGIALEKDDMLDEVDMTSVEMETAMRTRLRNRETLYVKKIDEALKRISDGSFGLCEDCNEEIEVKRLEARPTATLCVACKETEEHREHTHIDGHRRKSLGVKLRFA
jgi:DnaK suppressor protein